MDSERQGLKKRAIIAGEWVTIGYLLSQIIRFGGNLFLTRLLNPEIFGVMTIANVIFAGLFLISDIGLLQNVVQSHRGEEENYLNTAWTIQILRGGMIACIGLIAGGGLYLANYYQLFSSHISYADPKLPAVVIFTSMTAFISGFNSIHLLLLNRKLLLKKSVFIELTSQSIGLFVLIILAWRQRDIWALVEGNFVAALIKMLLSHSGLVPGRCRLQWEKQSVDEIVHFGKWIFLSSILGFLINQGDRLLLGGYVDNHTLGIYTVVFFLANAFKDILMRLIGSVFFPVLSEVVRNHPEKLAKVYYQIRHRIDTATMFVCGFLFANSQAIINFFYDNRYHDAGWMLQILSLSLIGNGYLLSTQCLLAKGLTKLEALQAFMQVVFFYTSFPIAYHYFQLVGAIWIIGTHVFFRVIISMIVMKKYLFLDLKKEFILLPVIFIGWITGSLFQVISYNLIHLAIKFIKQYDAESKSVLLILNKIYTALL